MAGFRSGRAKTRTYSRELVKKGQDGGLTGSIGRAAGADRLGKRPISCGARFHGLLRLLSIEERGLI